MIKYQKKVLLAEARNPFFIRHKATENNNEVTVVIVTYTLPLNNILPYNSRELSYAMLQAIFKAASSFQDINLEFNKDVKNPAFLFRVKAKTERRGDDVPNQALADKIVLTKANARAYIIAKRLIEGICNYLMESAKTITPIAQMLEHYANREAAYFKRMTELHK